MEKKPDDQPSAISRRSFAVGSGAFVASSLIGSQLNAAPGKSSAKAAQKAVRKAAVVSRPFTLGVASGDPTPTGVVLWTRLAPRPLDPGGGMPPVPVEVAFEVSRDEAMTKIVASGKAVAGPEWAHSVHVEVEGLKPGTWYWYRFNMGGEWSPKGRTRTLPPASSMPEKLRFAFASCQNYEAGYYTALDHLANEAPELVIHLGDYIYEGGTHKNLVRKHNSKNVSTLEEYRARYALYKTAPSLQRAHEVAPWIVTWDDHEVANNYCGNVFTAEVPPAEFLKRRAAAYQAYFEHMPLRRASLPKGADLLLYRGFDFGRLASFQVLDTRQYRSIPGSVKTAMSPEASILGNTQREWLFERLKSSKSVWNVIAQQVMMARVDLTEGAGSSYNPDKWAGYEMERRKLIRLLQEQPISNPVVLTGDIHSNWANEIPNDFDPEKSGNVAVEFVGTSISSGGDGVNVPARNAWLMKENPHVKFHNEERGYVMCEVTPKLWRADFRTVAYVTRKDAPLQTRASFVVESGTSKLVKL